MSSPTSFIAIIALILLVIGVIAHYISKHAKEISENIEDIEKALKKGEDKETKRQAKRESITTNDYLKRIDRGDFGGIHCDDCGELIEEGKEKEIEDEDDVNLRLLTLCKPCYTVRKFKRNGFDGFNL